MIRNSKYGTRLSRSRMIDCPYTGMRLLNVPQLNKGMGFPLEERKKFGLQGLLPSALNTLDEQVARAYEQFRKCPTNLTKNVFCESLKMQNEVLYYRFIRDHLKETFSIIYTPTQGEAIEKYSELFRKPYGCFLDINCPDDIESRLRQYGEDEDIDYIVVTDSEGILGIGDQGVGGVGISIAKLVLMTVCGGIDPSRTIPVVLDVGTDNQDRLHDPLYLGNRIPRVRGEKYDAFLDNFIQTVKATYPKAVLHFEDFGTGNALRLLRKYRHQLACFNDDIQGTGAVTVSGLTAAMRSMGSNIDDARIVIFGAGSAGTGIAAQIVDNFVAKGKTAQEAHKNLYLVDKPGLLLTSMAEKLTLGQQAFATDDANWHGVDTTSLLEIIKHVKPHVLIGCSTRPGSFTEEIVKEMAKHVERPIILPLSNPTRLHEAVPADLLKWTNGKALVATGSPFAPVNGREISENNNCFIFPGIGLGAVLSRARKITKPMIAAAVDALAEQSPILKNPDGGLLPDVADIVEISANVATAVVLQAVKDGVAEVEHETAPSTGEHVLIPTEFDHCLEWVKSQMWTPEYRPLRKFHFGV
jgi:malate dehydrogenase (oxaloacetate-decarboxylating)